MHRRKIRIPVQKNTFKPRYIESAQDSVRMRERQSRDRLRRNRDRVEVSGIARHALSV